MALAYELVCEGAEVVLVDRHDPGRATDAGAGILSPETNQDPGPGPFVVGCGAARHYEDLITRLADDGITDAGYARTGSMLIAERPGDDEVMDAAVSLIRGRAPESEEVDPDAAKELSLSFGHVGVPGPDDHINRRKVLFGKPECQRR